MKKNPVKEITIAGECVRKASVLWERLSFRRLMSNADPVIVLTVEKVGSVSMYKALRAAYNGALMHAHGFGKETPDWRQKYFEEHLREGGRIKLISAVRNPVARNLSEFFYYYSLRSPALLRDSSDEAVSKFVCEFLKKHNHKKQDKWLASNFKDSFDIDIYKKPFPASGYETYRSSVADLLLMRCELPNSEKEICIRDFTGCSSVQLGNLNRSEAMVGGALYSKVKKNGLPLSYVEEMLDSFSFKHFYNQGFACRIIDQWAAK